MKKGLPFVVLTLSLVGCESDKVLISGTRVPVVNYASSVKVDRETKDVSFFLPLSEIGRDWPQAGGNPDHSMAHFSLNDTLKPLWTISVGAGNKKGRLLSAPIVAQGAAYTLDTQGTVSAVEVASGQLLWQRNIALPGEEAPFLGGGLAYGQEKIFVTSPHAELLALNPATGELVWRYKTSSPVRGAPTLEGGRVYAVTINNQLEVVDAEKGTFLWSHAGITEPASLLGTASPAVSNGMVVVVYSSGEVYALKAENGHQLWTETLSPTQRSDSLSSLSDIKALPVIHKNTVIIIGHNHKMAAYDLRRGEALWERHVGGICTPAVIEDFIFMINSHNELVCLTRQQGQVLWVKKLGTDPTCPYKVLWEGPIVAGRRLYVVSRGGELLSIDPATGKTLGSHPIGSSFSLPPVVAQERLYLLTNDGNLMAFH